MRLIDADTFKEYICNAYEQVKHMYPDGGEWARQITEDFCKDIDEQPTIDISNNSNTLGALDCVDRQMAIDAVSGGMCSGWDCDVIDKLKALPSVQPTQLTDEDKEIIRIHLSAIKERLCNQRRWNEAREYEELINRLLSTLFVIQCKECKHWAIGNTTKNYPNPYICELHSFMHGFERSALPEDYCSWAELRGDSDEVN